MNRCPDEYELMFEEDARDELLLSRVTDYCGTVLEKLSDNPTRFTAAPLADMDEMDMFQLVAKPALRLLVGWLNDKMGGQKELTLGDMLSFVGCFLHAQMNKGSLTEALEDFESIIRDLFSAADSQRVLAANEVRAMAQAMTMVNPRGSPSHAEGTWAQSTDTVAKWRDYEKCVYEDSRNLFVNRRMALVIDDELIGSRSKEAGSKALSNREAGKEGIENDCVSESLFGAVLTTRHKARASYSVIESVEAVLDDVAEELGGNLDGVLGTCDGGYSNRQIWELFVRKGLGFMMISDNSDHPIKTLSFIRGKVGAALVREERQAAGAEARKAAEEGLREAVIKKAVRVCNQWNASRSIQIRMTKASAAAKARSMLDEDVLDNAVRLGLVRDKGFIVDDNKCMGREIFSATCDVTDSSKLTAFAVVDYQRSGADNANVVRFVAHGFPSESMKIMSRTITMTKQRLPQGFNKESDVLFFPDTSIKTAAVNGAEAAVARAARPLTCWQGSAEWHVLRAFAITGATGAQLARKDKEASKLVSVRAAREALASGCGCEGLDIGDDDDDLEACCSDADVDQVNKAVADEIALSDYEESDIDEPCDRFENALGDTDELTRSEDAARHLFQSWFGRLRSTVTMKTGTMNEDNILQSLKAMSWCKEIYEIGLCASISHPFLAVSADAIARVVPPDESTAVYVTCKFKTRVAEERKVVASRISKKYGQYFACTVGDETWWRAVPWLYRGQLIHQAMVFDFDHVLFVAATTTQIWYSVLVHVPRSARDTYCQALSGYKDLLTWAHDSVDVYGGPPPQVPEAFGPYRHTVASHLRLWRAMRKRVDKKLLPPIYNFKTMPQVLYNSLKGGLDGSAQRVEARTSPETLELGLDSSAALRGIKHLVRNAFVLYRFQKAQDTFEDDPPSCMSEVRSRMNNLASFTSFTRALARQLVVRSKITAKETEQPLKKIPVQSKLLTAEEVEQALENIPVQTKQVREFFDRGAAKRIRLCSQYNHARQSIAQGGTAQRRCVMCREKARKECSVCKVALHITRKSGATSEVTCWERFHRDNNLS